MRGTGREPGGPRLSWPTTELQFLQSHLPSSVPATSYDASSHLPSNDFVPTPSLAPEGVEIVARHLRVPLPVAAGHDAASCLCGKNKCTVLSYRPDGASRLSQL